MAGLDLPLLRNRRGIALALVLWVLVIGAALLTLGLFVAVQEQRAAGAERRLQHGFADAEAALAAALEDRTPGSLRLLLPARFDSLDIGGTLEDGARPWRGTLRRLGPALFFVEVRVDAQPEVATGPLHAQVRLGRLVQTRAPPVTITAALSVGGPALLGARAVVSGRDTSPPERAECSPSAPDTAVAGLAAGYASLSSGSFVDGSPPVQLHPATDSTLAPEDFRTFARLVSQATVTLPGGTLATHPATVGTACDLRAPNNWGAPSDPFSPCRDYLPIIHITGDLTLAGGEGQGILLVDGDLHATGSYRFYGIVLVRGRLDVAGGAGAVAFTGAVAAGAVGTASGPASAVAVHYSKCISANALLSSGPLVPLRSRSWKQLY